MEYAFAALLWSPDTFWRSTMHELLVAVNGYKAMNAPPEDMNAPATREEYERLKEKLDS